MKKLVLAAITASLVLSGCSNRIGDFTVASTKNVNMNGTQFTEGKRVLGTDLVPVILIPLGAPNIKEAMDVAIEEDRCAVAVNDVVIDNGMFAFLVGAFWVDVEGTLIMDESKEGCKGAGKRSRAEGDAERIANKSKKKSSKKKSNSY